MTPLEIMQKLYMDYIEQAAAAQKKQRMGDGILGFGRKASDDPCHERFIENLSRQMAEFIEAGISSQDLREVMAYVFQAQNQHREPVSQYWMLIAAHSTVQDMIPLLNREDAAALRELYGNLFKRRECLPVQTKIMKRLEKAMR